MEMLERYRQDEHRLRHVIAQRLHDGALPPEEPAQVVAGESEGHFCAACSCYMREGQSEVRAIGANGASTFFHPSCFALTAQVRAERKGAAQPHSAALQLLRALVAFKHRPMSASARS